MLFRDEEHVYRWAVQQNLPNGETLSLKTAWHLAIAWYHDRMDLNWRRKTPAEIRDTFQSLGLTSPFWTI